MNNIKNTQNVSREKSKKLDGIVKGSHHPRDILIGIACDIIKSVEKGEEIEAIKAFDSFSVEFLNSLDEKSCEMYTHVMIISVLELMGCSNLSRALSDKFSLSMANEYTVLNNIDYFRGVLRSECMSDIASKPRNAYYDEIMSIIKVTWERNPQGSKSSMIRQILAHYPFKVDESSLKRWIKKSGLTPPKPAKYIDFTIVFPDGGA